MVLITITGTYWGHQHYKCYICQKKSPPEFWFQLANNIDINLSQIFTFCQITYFCVSVVSKYTFSNSRDITDYRTASTKMQYMPVKYIVSSRTEYIYALYRRWPVKLFSFDELQQNQYMREWWSSFPVFFYNILIVIGG